MKRHPLVSVIIVNWNGGEVMRQCLESLSKIDYPNWELIVVDNGSDDGSDALPLKLKIKNENLKIIRNKKNFGFAVANNQGYRASRGKYILLLNNDTKVESDFLTVLVARIEKDSSVGTIQPKIFLMDRLGYLDNAGSFLTKIGFLEHWGFGQKDGKEFENEREIFSAKGACMLIRRRVINKVGFFDPEFFSYFEESDFCWRVWLGGWRVIYYPKANIYHKVGYTIRRLQVYELNYHYYKNRICSLVKNLENKNLFLILSPHIIISFGIALFLALRMQFKFSLIIFKALAWNFLNLPKTLEKRTTVQKTRLITDDQLLNRLAQPINWRRYSNDLRRIEEDLMRK